MYYSEIIVFCNKCCCTHRKCIVKMFENASDKNVFRYSLCTMLIFSCSFSVSNLSYLTFMAPGPGPVADRRARKEYWRDCKCNVRQTNVWRDSRRCHVPLHLPLATCDARSNRTCVLRLTCNRRTFILRMATLTFGSWVTCNLQVNHTDVFPSITTVSLTITSIY